MRDLRERLGEVLSEHEDLALALLFGSRARGTARIDSDIDLALLGHGRRLPTRLLIEIIGDVGAAFGVPVDVVDLHDTPEPVTGEALQGVRLLGSNDVFSSLLIRHLDNVEDFVPLQRRMFEERRERWLH